MATRQEIYAAIRNADAAGDADSVKKLGAYLKTMAIPSAPTLEDRAAADPSTGSGTLEPFGFDTGIPIPQGAMRALSGAGQGMADVGRGISQRLGFTSPEEIAAKRVSDAPLLATTAGKVGSFGGKAALMTLPAMIPGVNTLVGGAALGGASGLVEPTAPGESVLSNIGLGAAGGAAGSLAGKAIGAALRTGKAAAEPMYEAGRKAIIGRALNNAASSDAAAVANSLVQASEPAVGPFQEGLERSMAGEFVPGSVPNVAQAAGNPGISALQRAASATNPDVSQQLENLATAQNAARLNLLQRIAGTDGERGFTQAARGATAEQLYGAARNNGIPAEALTPEVQATMNALQGRLPNEVVSSAKDLARIKGMPMDDTTSVAGMHYVKQALDDAIASAKSSSNNTKASALQGLQKDFIKNLDALSPDYAQARGVYSAMSAPLNQMDIAQALIDKSVNPLTGVVQPAAYARALNDGLAAKATGMQGATLEGTLAPQNNNLLQSVLEDLKRSNAAQNAGKGVGSDTVQKLAYANMLNQSGVPNFLQSFAPAQVAGNLLARGGDALYGRFNRELSDQLANVFLNPQAASEAMSAANADAIPSAYLAKLAPQLRRAAALAPALTLTMPR